MKLLKGGVHLAVSGVTNIPNDGEFLIQCPATGIVYVLRKVQSSRTDSYYITPQQAISGQYAKRYAIFQYHGNGRRRIHFNDAQIDWAIRSGNFKIERV